VVIDAVRCAKLGLDAGLQGALVAPSAYFKKSPPVQVPDDRAREMTEAFIRNPRAAHAEGETLLAAKASLNGAAPVAKAKRRARSKPVPARRRRARA